MPTYRGNVGNLLQHWVFCEIVEAASREVAQVTFIDAHSMAPLAASRPRRDATSNVFDAVLERLPGEGTPYERAWTFLEDRNSVYPNSAFFLTHLWSGRYSLVLCEHDQETAKQLAAWKRQLEQKVNCTAAEVAEGDWRDRFSRGLAISGDLVLLSFDPYMFDRNGPGSNPKPGNMYPTDLDLIGETTATLQGPLLLQLSTYSANNDNPQNKVVKLVKSRLERFGFDLVGVARADGNMMSIVLSRSAGWVHSLGSLPSRFDAWLSRAKAGCHSVINGAV